MPFVDPGPGGNKILITAALDLAGLSRVMPVGLGVGISDIQAPVLAAGDHGLDALVQMIQTPVSMASAFGQGMGLQGTNALAIVLSGMTPLTAAALPSFEKIMAAHLGEVGGPWTSAAILGLNGNNTPMGMAESVIALAGIGEGDFRRDASPTGFDSAKRDSPPPASEVDAAQTFQDRLDWATTPAFFVPG